jgi:hypothetical protein
MRTWGRAAIVTAIFAACSPFSSSSDNPGATPEGEGGAPSGLDGGATSDASSAQRRWSCNDAPPHLFCDDFSSADWKGWNYPDEPNPPIQDAPGAKAHVDADADAPSPPIATFEFPGQASDGTATCGYAWTHQLIDLTATPRDKVTVSFDMKLVSTNPSDAKESVAFVMIKDATERRIEHYFMIRDPKNANVYEQWAGTTGKQGTNHALGDLSQPNWVHLELTIDAKNRQAGVALDGAAGSLWSFGDQAVGSIAKVVLGVGYTCTAVGGIAQFDNVLVTSN